MLLGVAALSACSQEDEESRQDIYATREDCLADWGNKPEDCRQATHPDDASRRIWVGPSYSGGPGFWGFRHNGWSHSHSIGSTGPSHSSGGVSRGGFGSHGSAHGAAGG